MGKTQDDLLKELDLLPYTERWVAIMRGQIAAVRLTEREARLASKHLRRKEEPQALFVSEETKASK